MDFDEIVGNGNDNVEWTGCGQGLYKWQSFVKTRENPDAKALPKNLKQWKAGVVQESLSLFEAVDGGLQRACRGATTTDNSPTNFVVTSAADLASCQLLLGQIFWPGLRSNQMFCPKIDFMIFLIFSPIFLVEWNPLGLDSRTALDGLDGLDGLRPGLSSNLRVMRCKTFGTLIETLWNYMEFIGILEVWIAFLFSHLFDVFVWPSIHKTSPTSKMWGNAFNWLVVKEWSFTMWMVVANCGPVQSKHPRSLGMQCATGHTPSVQTQFFAPFAFPITEI